MSKRLLTDEERKAKAAQIREAVKKHGVKLCEQNLIYELKPFVREVLKRIGFSGALVTDLSMMGDFPTEDMPLDEIFKFPVAGRDYVWEVAKRLKETEPWHGTIE